MSERDLALEIHHEIISPESVDAALDRWREMPLEHPEWDERKRVWFLLAAASHEATEAVLARRQSEAARTGPWDAPSEEREACARHIEALAIALRDNGPKSAEGLLLGTAGAQVGALLDAAASLRAGQEAVREYRPNSAHRPGGVGGSRPGPPGSLLPKRGAA